ncbi:MAG: YceI family protein [Chitinophagaceae bacterium]|nr:MAG: YceI family protein [Chitinophagaceae bacterium]
MKKSYLLLSAVIGVLSFSACTDAPESDTATTSEAKTAASASGEAYTVDPSASKIEWIGTKVTGHHQGSLAIKSGTINVQSGNVASGEFVLDMTSIAVTDGDDTASNNKLKGHLLSPDFFDASTHPEGKFVVTSVQPFSGTVADSSDKAQEGISKYKVTDPTHTISGNLTLKGVTKNVTFPAKVSLTDSGIEALAKFNINRKEWGIVYAGKPDDLIRDAIHLGISLKANK